MYYPQYSQDDLTEGSNRHMKDRKIVVLPKTRIGKWAVGLGIAFIVLIAIKIQDSFPMPTFSIAGLGLAGFIMAIIAIFKKKDRAILNFVPIGVGVVILVWFAAELMFPH